MSDFFSSYGGGIHHSAYIGGPPEHRDWKPGDHLCEPVIAPSARIEAFVTIDAGMNAGTYVGARSWLMKKVHIGHDAVVGEDCELAPGTVIGGHAELGDRVRCGVNATVLPYVWIGCDVRIGAGAVVTKDVPEGVVVVGNPARVLEKSRDRYAGSE